MAIAPRLSPELLGPADLDNCLSLDARALDRLWNATQWTTELEDPRRPCMGLKQENHLVALACGWLVADELHITAVAVDPEQRRRGLGRIVLQGLLREGACHGAAHATLEVSSANSAALKLYASAGFKTAGVRRAYYRNGDDALIQWLRLDVGDQVRITGHS